MGSFMLKFFESCFFPLIIFNLAFMLKKNRSSNKACLIKFSFFVKEFSIKLLSYFFYFFFVKGLEY